MKQQICIILILLGLLDVLLLILTVRSIIKDFKRRESIWTKKPKRH